MSHYKKVKLPKMNSLGKTSLSRQESFSSLVFAQTDYLAGMNNFLQLMNIKKLTASELNDTFRGQRVRDLYENYRKISSIEINKILFPLQWILQNNSLNTNKEVVGFLSEQFNSLAVSKETDKIDLLTPWLIGWIKDTSKRAVQYFDSIFPLIVNSNPEVKIQFLQRGFFSWVASVFSNNYGRFLKNLTADQIVELASGENVNVKLLQRLLSTPKWHQITRVNYCKKLKDGKHWATIISSLTPSLSQNEYAVALQLMEKYKQRYLTSAEQTDFVKSYDTYIQTKVAEATNKTSSIVVQEEVPVLAEVPALTEAPVLAEVPINNNSVYFEPPSDVRDLSTSNPIAVVAKSIEENKEPDSSEEEVFFQESVVNNEFSSGRESTTPEPSSGRESAPPESSSGRESPVPEPSNERESTPPEPSNERENANSEQCNALNISDISKFESDEESVSLDILTFDLKSTHHQSQLLDGVLTDHLRPKQQNSDNYEIGDYHSNSSQLTSKTSLKDDSINISLPLYVLDKVHFVPVFVNTNQIKSENLKGLLDDLQIKQLDSLRVSFLGTSYSEDKANFEKVFNKPTKEVEPLNPLIQCPLPDNGVSDTLRNDSLEISI